MNVLGLRIFALAALLAFPANVHAAPVKLRRLAVLPTILEGPYGATTVAEVFAHTAASAEKMYELDVATYNEVFVEGEVAVAATVRECGSDMKCIARALADRNVELGIRVIVNFGIEPPLVSLSLIESTPPRVTQESVTEVNELGAEALGKAIETATTDLLDRAAFTRAGRIIATTSPADATVRVLGDARPTKDPKVFLARAGRHELVAERADHEPARAPAVVVAGEDTHVAIELTAKPVEEGAPWLWIAIGAAVVAGTTTAVLIATDPFTSDPARGCVCITTASGDCTPCP